MAKSSTPARKAKYARQFDRTARNRARKQARHAEKHPNDVKPKAAKKV